MYSCTEHLFIRAFMSYLFITKLQSVQFLLFLPFVHYIPYLHFNNVICCFVVPLYAASLISVKYQSNNSLCYSQNVVKKNKTFINVKYCKGSFYSDNKPGFLQQECILHETFVLVIDKISKFCQQFYHHESQFSLQQKNYTL